MLLLGEEQFLFTEVQSAEQMLCWSWEKLAEEEKSPRDFMGQAEWGLQDRQTTWEGHLHLRALGPAEQPEGNHLFTKAGFALSAPALGVSI